MANMTFRAVVALLAVTTLVGCGALPQLGQSSNNADGAKPEKASAKADAPAPQSAPAMKPVAPQGQDAVVTLPSTQPFQQFKRGAGEGYAFKYRPRSKEDVVKMLRDPKAQKEMRVSCKVWVTQIAEAHKLPFEGCEGAAAVIEKDSDYKVEKCNEAMFQKNWLLVTNEKGDKFGAWHRKCYPDEKVLTYKGQPISSTTCMNPVILATPVAVSKTAQAPAPATSCPNPVAIRVNVWQPGVIEKVAGLKEVVEANKKDTTTNHFSPGNISRDWGDPILKASKNGSAVRSAVPYAYQVSIHKKGGGVVSVETPPTITGEHAFPMPAEFSEGDVMRVEFADLSKFHSPTSPILARWSEFQKATCGHRNNFHAIEK